MTPNTLGHDYRLTVEKIGKRIGLIQPLVIIDRVELNGFEYAELNDERLPGDLNHYTFSRLPWNSYWAQQNTHFVIKSGFSIPDTWEQPALFFPLGAAGDIFSHPEALMYLDGEPVAAADRHHQLIPLDAKFANNEQHSILLHGWTGLNGWPPEPGNQSRLFIKTCYAVNVDTELQELIALSEVCLDQATNLSQDQFERHHILNALDEAFHCLDTRDPIGGAFRASVASSLAGLRANLKRIKHTPPVTLHAIGHAHMDIAYLWPIAQVRQKNARTACNVLQLMERDESFTFSHSQPQLYDWLKDDFPDVYQKVVSYIQSGQWEMLGGMWVEPDMNLPGSEALVRQCLLARQWCDEHLQQPGTPVLWLPDTFGFPASVPQVLKQAGIDTLITNKLNWNQYNRMPATSTHWQGIDGTRIKAHMLTTPRGVQHLPFPTNYKSDLTAGEVNGTWRESRVKNSVSDLLICYGYGDGGGGPNAELASKARLWQEIPAAPNFTRTTVQQFLSHTETEQAALPTWSGELYLEGHRGTLTSQGWIKKANRNNEGLLHTAEWLNALAEVAGTSTAPLTDAWRKLCLNQFHDVITGAAITEVFEEARQDHAFIEAEARSAMQRAALSLTELENTHITGQFVSQAVPLTTSQHQGQHTHQGSIKTSTTIDDPGFTGTHHVLANSAPLPVNRYVVLPALSHGAYQDSNTGHALASQPIEEGVLVALPEVPGYSLTSVRAAEVSEPPVGNPVKITIHQRQGAAADSTATNRSDDTVVDISNQWLSLIINNAGQIISLFDKPYQRELIPPEQVGNELITYEDRPVSWDAWDIDSFYQDRPDPMRVAAPVKVLEEGPLRAVIQTTLKWQNSTVYQTIAVHHHTRRIDFHTRIDWHDTHTLLKAHFPLAIHSDHATYDIQWGHITRPTHQNTAWDAAKFEVCAHKWADLSEYGYGVALLNNGKYGHSADGNGLSLSLLKSPTMPDPTSDQGIQTFTYSLLPHPGNWRDDVPAEAYALNLPLQHFKLIGEKLNAIACKPILHTEQPNVVIETIKPAEQGDGLIVRLYEAFGATGTATFTVAPYVHTVEESSLLEDSRTLIGLINHTISLNFRPHQIRTLRLSFN